MAQAAVDPDPVVEMDDVVFRLELAQALEQLGDGHAPGGAAARLAEHVGLGDHDQPLVRDTQTFAEVSEHDAHVRRRCVGVEPSRSQRRRRARLRRARRSPWRARRLGRAGRCRSDDGDVVRFQQPRYALALGFGAGDEDDALSLALPGLHLLGDRRETDLVALMQPLGFEIIGRERLDVEACVALLGGHQLEHLELDHGMTRQRAAPRRRRQVELLGRGQKAVLGLALTGAPFDQRRAALEGGVDVAGLVDEDGGSFRQVVPQRVECVVEIGEAELDAGKEDPGAQPLEHHAPFVATDLEVEPAHLDRAPDLRLARDAGVELAHWQDQQLGLAGAEALTDGIELVYDFDRVADELQAQRVRMGGGEDVDDAAADGEVAAIFDEPDAPIAPAAESFGDGVAIDVLAFDDVEVASREDGARRHALGERFGRRDDYRVGALTQVVQSFDPCGDDVGGRRQILERRYLPARQAVDAARERRRVVGFIEEETQIGAQPLRLLAVGRDHQGGAGGGGQQAIEEERACAAFEPLHTPSPRGVCPRQPAGKDAQRASPGVGRVRYHGERGKLQNLPTSTDRHKFSGVSLLRLLPPML
jgi:hypothetical protein